MTAPTPEASRRHPSSMPRDLLVPRAAVATIFFANGAGFASWVPHIPMVQAKLELTPAALGGTLLAMAAGSLIAIPLSGRLTARLGSRTTVRATAALFFGALVSPVLAPSWLTLVVALFVLGAGNGSLDVAMNAQAVAVEARTGRPIMSSFHGMWSLGGFAGAALAIGALRAGWSPAAHIVVATLLFGAAALVAVLALLPPEADVRDDGPRFVRPTRVLIGLGMIALLALVSEGAMGDWSAVYLQHTLGTTPAMAATGFAAFSLTMAAGRFLGDRLVARFGDASVVRTCAAGGAVAFGLALLLGHPLVAIVGFACVGFGIANLIPIVFRAASALPGVAPSEGIAAVGTFGYVGFLAGPPVIGLAAEALTLPAALALVVAALAWIALSAGRVGPTG